MAFFDDDEKKEQAEEKPEAPTKIKVGDTEFEPDELEGLVGKVREIEKTHGKLDDVISNYGRRANEVGQLRRELDELRESRSDQSIADKQAAGQQLTDDEIRKLAAKQGFVTTDNFGELVTKHVQSYSQAQKLVDQMNDMEKQNNPYKDEALPKFQTGEMLEYMNQTGIKDPEIAYEIKYKTEIRDWKDSQIKGAKPSRTYTETASAPGNKEPEPLKVNRDNLREQMRAALNQEI